MRHHSGIAVLTLVGFLSCATSSRATRSDALDTEAIREFLANGLEANKAMDIDFARAIPDSALRWAPTPDVRDFAQQIAHAADNSWIASGLGVEARAFGDTAVVLNDKEALVAAVTAAYDWMLGTLRDLPDDQFTAEGDFFGTPTPRWRMFMQAIEHATWTRGQLVGYFHAHGVPVPRVRFF